MGFFTSEKTIFLRKCWFTNNLFVLMVFLFVLNVNSLTYEGETCSKSGVTGTCINIMRCQTAIDDIRRRINPQICSFDGQNPIVCCVDSGNAGTSNTDRVTTTTRRYVATPPPRQQQSSTTEYIPPVYDYKEEPGTDTCQPISTQLTTQKTGRKAWDKCLEYQEQLVYPCETGVALAGELTRTNHCHHNANELIVGGTDAGRGEFPHMALLGYGASSQKANWVCGGTLISDRFILTAGHCTSSREYGEVKYIQVGLLKRSEKLDLKRVYDVGQVIKHPEYKPPNKYNDIALLQSKTRIILSQYIVPACLDIGDGVKYDHASATGWGLTTDRGSVSDVLQKVTLTKFNTLECASSFPPDRRMKQGLQTTQICYGDRTKSKDTCQGDSGGPLQVNNKKINCMYTVIGVTSFGKACGFEGVPAIYTRVAAYTAWIESVVWP